MSGRNPLLELPFFEQDTLREDVEDTMLDRCEVGENRAINDDTGEPDPIEWYFYSSIRCGYGPQASKEVQVGDQATLSDAEFRFPFDTQITGKNRIRLVERWGRVLETPLEFAVIGNPRLGQTCLTVSCTQIVGESRL